MIFNTQKKFDDYIEKFVNMTPRQMVEYFNENTEEKDAMFYQDGSLTMWHGFSRKESRKKFDSLFRSLQSGEIVLKLKQGSDGYTDYYLIEENDGTTKLLSKSGQHSLCETPIDWLTSAIEETRKNLMDLEDIYNAFLKQTNQKGS